MGVIADMDNLSSLTAAFGGCDGVYLYFPFGFDMKLLKKRLENVKTAAKQQKIKFLIYSNGIVARSGSGIKFLEDALAIESLLMSEIPGCILKPASFMDEFLDGLSFKVYTNPHSRRISAMVIYPLTILEMSQRASLKALDSTKASGSL